MRRVLSSDCGETKVTQLFLCYMLCFAVATNTSPPAIPANQLISVKAHISVISRLLCSASPHLICAHMHTTGWGGLHGNNFFWLLCSCWNLIWRALNSSVTWLIAFIRLNASECAIETKWSQFEQWASHKQDPYLNDYGCELNMNSQRHTVCTLHWICLTVLNGNCYL